MNLLIAGHLGSLTGVLAKQFSKERIRVVLAGPHAKDLKIAEPNVSTYSIALNDVGLRELMSTFKFEAVIYLAKREEQLLARAAWNAGEVLDGLQSALEFGQQTGVEKFIFVSSTEVYGDQEDTAEIATPQPASPNGYLLTAAEQSCLFYSRNFGLNVTVVRIPFLYGPEEKDGILYHLIRGCQAVNRVTLPAAADRLVSFMPAASLADFLLRVLDVDMAGWRVVNLSSAHPISLGEFGDLLKSQFPGLEVSFEAVPRIFTRAATVSSARHDYDWLPVDQLAADLPGLLENLQTPAPRRWNWLERLREKFPQYPVYLKWIEIFLGALAMMWLTDLTGSFVEFRYVDFRLMYVILIGSMYGTQAGLLASLLACASVVLGARRLGLEWTELVYNIANWLPFAVYLTAGALTGYLQDKKENQSNFQNEQNRLISEKYAYLYGVHQDVVQIKDQYYQQLLGSRDSFGRIFNITRQLDTLDEEEVLFKALNILEDVMSSSSIAIYSMNSANHFARLEVYSSTLGERIGRSLDLQTLPELQASIDKGEIFENRRLLPNYPAYFAPIVSGEHPVAAIAIWDARFEHGSLYYYNLFKVICGLVESSIQRAIIFLNAARDKFYVPGTRILQPEAFKRILRIRETITKQKSSNYLLAMVTATGSSDAPSNWETVERSLSPIIRSVDDIGLLDDGNLYVIFSQADESDALALNKRLSLSGLGLEPVVHRPEALAQGTISGPVTRRPDGLLAQGESHE